MNKLAHILLYVCLLGFFLAPVTAMACTSHEVVKKEKSCCEVPDGEEHSTDDCEMECCKEQNSEDSGCSGNCGKQTCQNSFQTFFVHQVIKNDTNGFGPEGVNSYPLYRQPYYSLGFHFIWQPPKIA